ncbi:hypothetical protein LTSEMIN_5819, partial [Salmonella enterica subsp. enterica serovar Minnesota str. A4-603]
HDFQEFINRRVFFSGCRNVYNPGKSAALIIIFNII